MQIELVTSHKQILFDFSSTFDRDPQKQLIGKLTTTGIHNPIVVWISSDIENRK